MKKSLYAKEMLCFPGLPLKQSSVSADLAGGWQKSSAWEHICPNPKLLFFIAITHINR